MKSFRIHFAKCATRNHCKQNLYWNRVRWFVCTYHMWTHRKKKSSWKERAQPLNLLGKVFTKRSLFQVI